MDSESSVAYPVKENLSHANTISSLEAVKSLLGGGTYPENEKKISHRGTCSPIEDSSMDVDHNDNNDNVTLNKDKDIGKRKLNFDTDEDGNTADSLNRDDQPVKRRKKCPVKSKARTAERRVLRRMTVRKLQNIKDAESSLWRYLLVSNILCRIYEQKHYKAFK